MPTTNNTLVQNIDKEIEARSLLNHPFYKMWSAGELNLSHLQGYAKEYFQLVKSVPAFVENIASKAPDSDKPQIEDNAQEESEHIQPWIRFANSLGVLEKELIDYYGIEKTNHAVENLMSLSQLPFEQAVAAMYAYEMELPKISTSKIDGLKKYYNLDNEDATKYFELHQEADIRHAQVWRDILNSIPEEKYESTLNAAIESLKAQNLLLDAVYEEYVRK